MLGIYDYLIIGYLVILCLCAAYLRRDNKNKLKSYLSLIFLMCGCLSILAYFILYYLIDNYEKYLLYYFIISILILLTSILVLVYKLKRKELSKNEENK